MKKLVQKLNMMEANIMYALTNKSGASLWEYLLVIAIVCIIGGALIILLTGADGETGAMKRVWDALETRIFSVFQINNGG